MVPCIILSASPRSNLPYHPSDALTMPRPAEVKKIINLPVEDVEEFDRKHPQHGSFTWFVREALRRYNEISHPDPLELVNDVVADIPPLEKSA